MAEGELFRASIIGRLDDGTAIVNDFGYFDASAGSTHIDTGIAAGDFQTLVQAKFVAALPDIWSAVRYRFACTHGAANGEVGYVDVVPVVPGAATSSNVLPNEICIVMKRSTGYASRGDRGRIFLGPVSPDFVGDVNAPALTAGALLNVMNLLKTDLVTQGRTLKPVIVRADGNFNGHQITKVAINPIFGHRRTRRPRVGV